MTIQNIDTQKYTYPIKRLFTKYQENHLIIANQACNDKVVFRLEKP